MSHKSESGVFIMGGQMGRNKMSECIKCGASKTEWWRHEDGHFRKECLSCGYVGGPYLSQQRESGQSSFMDW